MARGIFSPFLLINYHASFLTVRTESPKPIPPYRSLSVQGLLPEFVATQSLTDIVRMRVVCDNQPAQLGDFFHVDGKPRTSILNAGVTSHGFIIWVACSQEQSSFGEISADIQENR